MPSLNPRRTKFSSRRGVQQRCPWRATGRLLLRGPVRDLRRKRLPQAARWQGSLVSVVAHLSLARRFVRCMQGGFLQLEIRRGPAHPLVGRYTSESCYGRLFDVQAQTCAMVRVEPFRPNPDGAPQTRIHPISLETHLCFTACFVVFLGHETVHRVALRVFVKVSFRVRNRSPQASSLLSYWCTPTIP